MEYHDAIIIGGGPAGLSAAILLGRARRNVVVIDAGEPRNRKARQVNGYLGLDGVSPMALRAKGELQARKVGVHFLQGEVTDAACLTGSSPTLFHVLLADGTKLAARKLLFATGIRDQLPEIPGFKECYGVSVHHCPYCDGWEHRDARIVVFGQSGESATSLAEALLRWSSKVTVVTNGTKLSEAERERLTAIGIPVEESPVEGLDHEGGFVESVMFRSGGRLAVDSIFFSGPSKPCSDLPIRMGCRVKDKDRVETTDRQGTGVPGIFLAGDAGGDVQFTIVAAAEGAVAGMALNKELQEEDLVRKRGPGARSD
jgi:thioredoxin reductase